MINSRKRFFKSNIDRRFGNTYNRIVQNKKVIKSESIYRNKELELLIKFLLTPDELEIEEIEKLK